MARVVASIEARMGSSRFPGKVLKEIAGKPALSRLLARLRQCETLDDIVLATSTAPADDALEAWAKAEGVPCYRGSEDDVLQRVVDAHEMMQSDVIVEITGDCILSDPEVVDLCVNTFFANDADYLANCIKPGYPMGICVQVFRTADLCKIANEIDDPAVREHVSLYFYEHPETYRLLHLIPPASQWGPDYRIVLDYPEDLELMRAIYEHLLPEHDEAFTTYDIVQLLKKKPELLEINRHCVGKTAR